MLINATQLNLITRLLPSGYIHDVWTISGPGAYYPNRFYVL